MPARFSCIRSPTARSTSSAVSLTVLHAVRTIAITGFGGASGASWTRVGHVVRDQLTRAPACVIEHPPMGYPAVRDYI